MAKIAFKPGQTFPFTIEGLHYITGKPVSLYIIGDTIAEIREIKTLQRGSENIIVAPGLIDNQINGYAGVDFSGKDLTSNGVLEATKAIMKDGVTSFIPTLITNSHEALLLNFSILNESCRDEIINSCVPGFHLEGPYISPEDGFRGCHSAKYIRKPSWDEFMKYQDAAEGRIIQVTVAPEVDGAQEFIKKCRAEGIIVGIGHSNAIAEDISEAVKNGAGISTHLGNGCANMIHRHNNPIWPQLSEDELFASIIADGNHLLPEEIRVFIRAKGEENIILTSDVVYLTGMKPGRYEFSGTPVILKENGMLMTEFDCLAGASFPLIKGVENVMRMAGMNLAGAISMASENVSRFYGIRDRGMLKEGMKADIILLELEEDRINLKRTYKNGIPVL
ncbi:MAG TPA: N-acetylglucosamine-6-phosphate deacetylase [Bacteroidales bacterium]|nr:N-acetylglucosamine-6-phosphate deacetylase [Bacteroidales bacterium]